MKVEVYNLKARNGKHIRRAHKITWPSGKVVRYMELLSAKQLREQRLRGEPRPVTDRVEHAPEAPIKTWAKAIVAASSYPDAMVEGLAAEHAKVLAQRDNYKASAEALAEELREVLKYGSAGNENLIRAALAKWEEGQ